MSVKEGVKKILTGAKPDRLPFIDRIELWYRRHFQQDSMPQAYRGKNLNQIHADNVIGRQKFCMPCRLQKRSGPLVIRTLAKLILWEKRKERE
jgi:hypothetical protein